MTTAEDALAKQFDKLNLPPWSDEVYEHFRGKATPANVRRCFEALRAARVPAVQLGHDWSTDYPVDRYDAVCVYDLAVSTEYLDDEHNVHLDYYENCWGSEHVRKILEAEQMCLTWLDCEVAGIYCDSSASSSDDDSKEDQQPAAPAPAKM